MTNMLEKLRRRREEMEEEAEEIEDAVEDYDIDEEEEVSRLMADLYRRSEETAFHRWSTEIEPHLEEKEFLERHRNFIRAINKFAPLSYITDNKILLLNSIRRLKIRMLERVGLYDEAEAESLKILASYQESRGVRGFFTKALITQRRILHQYTGRMEGEREKKSTFGLLFRKRPPQPAYYEEEF